MKITVYFEKGLYYLFIYCFFLPEDDQYQLIVSHLYIDVSDYLKKLKQKLSNWIELIPISKPNKDNKNR